MTSPARPERPYAALSLALVAFVFAVDLNLPLGVASAVPYTFAVLLALGSKRRGVAPAVAALCGFLTVVKLGIVTERGGTEMWKVVANRCLALFSIVVTTILGILRRKADAERRAAEEKLRERLADLAYLGRVKTASQLATGLAHELNQPLAAVCLQADLAAQLGASDDPAARAELADALREISDQSRRAAEIIRTLRRMVRQAEPVHEAVDVNEVARSVVRVIDWQAQRAGVAVHLRLSDDPPPPAVLGDRAQLEQVAFNLLQNAVEAAAGAADGPRVAQIETGIDPKGRATVTVRDTGPGLPAGNEGQVFERFFTTKTEGMGLGLAIGKSIVEAHGGELYVAPMGSRGAAFEFALPASNGGRA